MRTMSNSNGCMFLLRLGYFGDLSMRAAGQYCHLHVRMMCCFIYRPRSQFVSSSFSVCIYVQLDCGMRSFLVRMIGNKKKFSYKQHRCYVHTPGLQDMFTEFVCVYDGASMAKFGRLCIGAVSATMLRTIQQCSSGFPLYGPR